MIILVVSVIIADRLCKVTYIINIEINLTLEVGHQVSLIFSNSLLFINWDFRCSIKRYS